MYLVSQDLLIPDCVFVTKQKGQEILMFSPNLMRYIICPDSFVEKSEENRKISVEKQIFRFSILDYKKIAADVSILRNHLVYGHYKYSRSPELL
jgi:hypothetical protein